MICVYCGAPAEWLMCNECIIKTYEFQKSLSETFLETARSEEWKNELLEQHSLEHIKLLDEKIRQLREDS